MPLLERVATLIKANLNDLISKAENPEKLLAQLVLDLQNQFIQVKTQAAAAIAEQHSLRQKHLGSVEEQRDWLRRAELALSKGEEQLARQALERSLSCESAARGFAEQRDLQAHQVRILRDAMDGLQAKIVDTETKAELLLARRRSARIAKELGQAGQGREETGTTMKRIAKKVAREEAEAVGAAALDEPSLDGRMEQLERDERVDRLLAELKARNGSVTLEEPLLLTPKQRRQVS